MRTQNSSVKKIQARRNELRKIMLEAQHTGKPRTREELLKQLAEKGFDIDFSTLYRDKIEINRTNTFIEDIAESEYSPMQEDIYNKLLYVEEQALQLYNKDWKISRFVKRNLPDGSITESSIVHDDKPKLQCLGLIKDVQILKRNALKGDPVNLSFVMLSKKLSNLKEELGLTTRQLNEYQRENTELKEKLNKLDQGSIT